MWDTWATGPICFCSPLVHWVSHRIIVVQQLRKTTTIWAKIQHIHIQTEIHFIVSAYSYTVNNYTYSLPPLANVDRSAFTECFLLTVLIYEWWNGANGGLQFGSREGPDMAPTVIAHLSRSHSGIVALCGSMYMS